jgi:hypothetical protein
MVGKMDGWMGVKPDLMDCLSQSKKFLKNKRLKKIKQIKNRINV